MVIYWWKWGWFSQWEHLFLAETIIPQHQLLSSQFLEKGSFSESILFLKMWSLSERAFWKLQGGHYRWEQWQEVWKWGSMWPHIGLPVMYFKGVPPGLQVPMGIYCLAHRNGLGIQSGREELISRSPPFFAFPIWKATGPKMTRKQAAHVANATTTPWPVCLWLSNMDFGLKTSSFALRNDFQSVCVWGGGGGEARNFKFLGGNFGSQKWHVIARRYLSDRPSRLREVGGSEGDLPRPQKLELFLKM